jgi:hypothetical protein
VGSSSYHGLLISLINARKSTLEVHCWRTFSFIICSNLLSSCNKVRSLRKDILRIIPLFKFHKSGKVYPEDNLSSFPKSYQVSDVESTACRGGGIHTIIVSVLAHGFLCFGIRPTSFRFLELRPRLFRHHSRPFPTSAIIFRIRPARPKE